MSANASVLHLVNAVPGTIVRLGSKKLSRLHHHQERCFRGVVSTGKHLKQLLLASGELGVSCRLRNRRVLVTEAMTSATLSKKQAQDLAVKLTPDERDVLISALQECQSRKTKAEYEGQLAAFRWRSKFGRPSRVPTLGDVDPTGSYCAVPDDWLLRKYVETVPQPSRRDLMRVSVANAIPFIGFGFLDNSIMIIAGDQIETSLGAIISLSTMAAAAFGNTISDILGIGSAYYVELLAQKIGFEPPKLTPIQLDMPKSRRAANMGRVIGITVGCLLGMTPLLFLHQEHKDKNQDNEEKAPDSKSK